MEKQNLCKQIGQTFGDYFEEDGQLCIDNGENIFRYNNPDELLADWVDTLVQQQIAIDSAENDNGNQDFSRYWENEVIYIYEQVIGKYPVGVKRLANTKLGNACRWKCYVDVGFGKYQSKTIHLGIYSSVVDAIAARQEFLLFLENQHSEEEILSKAKELSRRQKRKRQTKCERCGRPLVRIERDAYEQLSNESSSM